MIILCNIMQPSKYQYVLLEGAAADEGDQRVSEVKCSIQTSCSHIFPLQCRMFHQLSSLQTQQTHFFHSLFFQVDPSCDFLQPRLFNIFWFLPFFHPFFLPRPPAKSCVPSKSFRSVALRFSRMASTKGFAKMRRYSGISLRHFESCQ